MRTGLFSDDALSEEINRRFVCTWVNQRPDQKFPDRRRIRTKCGPHRRLGARRFTLPVGTGTQNVTSIFAAPDGTVLTAVPGYLDAEHFRKEMNLAVELHSKMFGPEGRLDEAALEIYRVWHKLAAAGASAPDPSRPGTLEKSGHTIPEHAHAQLAAGKLITSEELKFEGFNERIGCRLFAGKVTR